MPAYNFQERFALAVERGDKNQTIRRSDRGARHGMRAHLFTGQRTAACRRLGVGTITGVLPIEIGRNGCGEPYAVVWFSPICPPTSMVHNSMDALSRDDGFRDRDEMVCWFEGQYGLPFKGFLHQWARLDIPGKKIA